MEELLKSIIERNRHLTKQGRVATYIPELSKANGDALGVCVYDLKDGCHYGGEFNTKFTIQSVSKIIILLAAILDNGADCILSNVGVEPTAASFNSIVDLETRNAHRPMNPMINSGAIVTTSMIKGKTGGERVERLLHIARKITGNKDININKAVYCSEKETGDRNRSLAFFMKSTGVMKDDVDQVLDVYFRMCSLEVTCADLAKMAAFLANEGTIPWSGEVLVSKDIARIIKSVMATCGMYNASGEFAVDVGIPGKSGVGGGILAVAPKRMGIGVIGPALDEKGNSIGGLGVLKSLSKELELSIY